MADPITEADLDAFIDGELDPARRIEVEEHLAGRPDAAARVMADLRARDLLKLAFADAPARPSLALLEAAHRIERSLSWRRIALRCRRAAAIVLLVGIGWLA